MITAGVDLGTQTVKVVILKDGKVVARGKGFSGFDPANSAKQAMEEALKAAKLKTSDLSHVTATGANMSLAPKAEIISTQKGIDLVDAFYGIKDSVRAVKTGDEIELGKNMMLSLKIECLEFRMKKKRYQHPY